MVRSQLFTVRVWVEEVTANRVEKRGLVRHVPSGESTYFRDWSTLVAFLDQWTMVEPTDAPRDLPA